MSLLTSGAPAVPLPSQTPSQTPSAFPPVQWHISGVTDIPRTSSHSSLTATSTLPITTQPLTHSNYQAGALEFQDYKVVFRAHYAQQLPVKPGRKYDFAEAANILASYCAIHQSKDVQEYRNFLALIKGEAAKANVVFHLTSLIQEQVMVFSALGPMCTGVLQKFELHKDASGEKICLQIDAVGLELNIWDIVSGLYSVTSAAWFPVTV